jgi:ArsR family transcriptional regulator, zinc-responsive transcriptional repressor
VPPASRSSVAAPKAAGTSAAISEAGLEAAAELLRALANAHRLAIVAELNDGPRCVHELVEALGVSQPLVSQHLRILRASHLVRAERRGREIAYSLGDEHVFHIVHDAVLHATEGQPSGLGPDRHTS